jgi:RNA polymerase sigma factor (sigma-70 family)
MFPAEYKWRKACVGVDSPALAQAIQIAATLRAVRLARQNEVYQAAAFRLRVSKSEKAAAPTPQEPPVRDDPSVADLVARAAGSDEDAWHELVDRYAPLVWSICARHQLSRADIEDVGQTVWLRLVEHLGKLREPAALPGWLATTTQRECVRVLKAHRKCEVFGTDPDNGGLPLENETTMIEEEVLMAERNALLRAAFDELPEDSQRLITLLLSDPPLSYVEIGEILGMPPGSIGPTRQRCLDRLRRSPHLRGLTDADFHASRVTTPGGESRAR